MIEHLHCLKGPFLIENSALVGPTYAETEVTFFVSKERSEWGTLELSRVATGTKFTKFVGIKTPVVSLNELVENWDCPDMVICDIEGSEIDSFVLPLTKNHIEFFSKTLICIEVSKDNWREIVGLFARTRRFFQ